MKSQISIILTMMKKFLKCNFGKEKTFDVYSNLKSHEKAKKIIDSNQYLSLSTCENDIPWAATVWYATDNDYNFFFVSSPDSRHCQNIKVNNKVAFTIYDSTLPPELADGVQIEGLASKVDDSGIQKILEYFWGKRFDDKNEINKRVKSYDKYTSKGKSLRKFYCITPQRIYKVDESITNVDLRLEIMLNDIIKSK